MSCLPVFGAPLRKQLASRPRPFHPDWPFPNRTERSPSPHSNQSSTRRRLWSRLSLSGPV